MLAYLRNLFGKGKKGDAKAPVKQQMSEHILTITRTINVQNGIALWALVSSGRLRAIREETDTDIRTDTTDLPYAHDRTLYISGEPAMVEIAMARVYAAVRDVEGQVPAYKGELYMTLEQLTTPDVSPRCFFMFSVNNVPQGRVVIELQRTFAPTSVVNFETLAIGDFRDRYGRIIQYAGTCLHGIDPTRQLLVGGDVQRNNGTGGCSIYGERFEERSLERLTFDQPGTVAMLNCGQDEFDSIFFICTVAKDPDSYPYTMPIGRVIEGLDVLRSFYQYGDASGRSKAVIRIDSCGKL